MKKIQISPKILALEFPSQKEVALSAYRFAEFYECDSHDIKDKYFTHDMFLEHFMDENGNITYFNDFSGFNIPKEYIDDFTEVFLGELSEREEKVIKACSSLPDNGYVILYVKGDINTKEHELAHALFYTDESYRDRARKIMSGMRVSFLRKIIKNLSDIHYSEDVFEDEINSYMSVYDSSEDKEVWKDIPYEKIEEYLNKFRENFLITASKL